ncbi:CDP-glycerol glycerophosphotransferase family protein, partial [Cronobacter sakazakii]|uniref:CDP-glycerol glycerophosphotransferase family protein n=1 Tax=Cronobacter sakazakii TaxID=28141 RepID=UPI00294B2BB5
AWLNTKDEINCFITSSPAEYHSISDNLTKYFYSKKDVFLTGFPRHDRLIKSNNVAERLIVIMPTWRQTIVGKVLGNGDEREINPLFMHSEFATRWKSVLHSPLLEKCAKQYNYRVAFFPHFNILPYLNNFDVPEYIEVLTHVTGSIQEVLSRVALMITDYSSVAFEMAVQNKQIIYYQFDAREFFAGHV